MNTQHEPGNVFRERFADFSKEPPPDTWDKVKNKLGTTTPRSSVTLSPLWLSIMAVAITFTITLFIFLNYNKQATVYEGRNSMTLAFFNGDEFRRSGTTSDGVQENTAVDRGMNSTFNNATAPQYSVKNNLETTVAKSQQTVAGTLQNNSTENTDIAAQPENVDDKSIITSDPSGEQINPQTTLNGIQSQTVQTENENILTDNTQQINGQIPVLTPSDKQDQSPAESNRQGITATSADSTLSSDEKTTSTQMPVKQSDYGKTPGWDLGLNIVPEYFVTGFSGSTSKWNYSLEICGTYHLHNLYFQSGIGLGFSQQQVSHNRLYKVNEISGSYQDVTSYTWDSISQSPEFNTITVNYYDSVQRNLTASAAHRYTLLHIPVLLGYTYNVKRFTLFLNGGLQYSLVLSERNNAVAEPLNASRLIEDKPARTVVNENGLALLLGCGVVYHINHRFALNAEPVFKYYFKDIYGTPDAAGKPISTGIRAGMIFKL